MAVPHHSFDVGETQDGALVGQSLDVKDGGDEFVDALHGGEADVRERCFGPEPVLHLVEDGGFLELQHGGDGVVLDRGLEMGEDGERQTLEELVDVGGGEGGLQHHGGGGAGLHLGFLAAHGDGLPLGEACKSGVGLPAVRFCRHVRALRRLRGGEVGVDG